MKHTLLSTLVFLNSFFLLNTSHNVNKEVTQTAMFSEEITLNDGDIFDEPLYIEHYCLDFSNLIVEKPSVIIRSLETDIKYNDLLKVSIERVMNFSFSSLEALHLSCHFDSPYRFMKTRYERKDNWCYFNNISLSDNAISEVKTNYNTYYQFDFTGDKVRNFIKRIFASEQAVDWIIADIITKYNQISYVYPDDWKLSMVKDLTALETFVKGFNQNKYYYQSIANNKSKRLQDEIGPNQAFIFRRIVNDGLNSNQALEFIIKLKTEIKNSIGNGHYSHYKDYIINDGNLIASVHIYSTSYAVRSKVYLTSKNSTKKLEFQADGINTIKCLQEDGKDYFLITSRNCYSNDNIPKQMLIDQELNVITNSY